MAPVYVVHKGEVQETFVKKCSIVSRRKKKLESYQYVCFPTVSKNLLRELVCTFYYVRREIIYLFNVASSGTFSKCL